ncbi:MAG: MBL fold metallo-hydrolase [Candidatus Competibacterales bacterium]|nr:MBL fold metallo-hydrolase [Candidatus Competibacterales bacterium]
MHLQFHGAAGEVTGSCHLVEVGGRRVLLDCGLIQGGPRDEARNREPFPFDPASIDALVLSHAHIDHSGRIPQLVQAGFRGPVYTQRACRDLCRVMLRDAAFLQEKDAERDSRKRQRKGLAPLPPLYTQDDVRACLHRFKALDYGERREILPGVSLRLQDAGHILGSACVELWLEAGGQRRKLVFSGDLGHAGAPILRDPALIEEADLVLMESTYGDRLHRSREATWQEMAEVFAAAEQARGNILIPAFAVGRTQELLYLFGQHYEDWNLQRWRIVLDSPLAIEATEIYLRHSQLYDDQARAYFRAHRSHPLLPQLQFSRTANQSMALNRIRSGLLVIAGSGMCTGGRIRHHLKHNVWRRDCHLVMVGFQARGTPGRALVDGARHIRLWGEALKVNARVHTIGGFSAHADQAELCEWYGRFRGHPPLWLVHGEPRAAEALAGRLCEDRRARVKVAASGERIDLLELPAGLAGPV